MSVPFGADVPIAHDPGVAATIEAAARESTHLAGLPPDVDDDVRWQIREHLEDKWSAEVGRGVSSDVALRNVLREFGGADVVRRGFSVRRLKADARAAAALELPWIAAILLDAIAGFARARQVYEMPPTMVFAVSYVVLSAVTLWIAAAVFRFAWKQCRLGLHRRVTWLELGGGAGLLAAAGGLFLFAGAGFLSPTLCDLIDQIAGRDVPLALSSLAGGLAAGLYGLVAGIGFRRAPR